jgi:glycine/sarcosine N-methyltransferase
MAGAVENFYDDLASHYHLVFEDWEASIASQAAVLAPILARESHCAVPMRVLDCARGIGTQLLGLAKEGLRVTGADFSSHAIERARVEASARGLDLRLHVADMLHLDAVPESGFDAVICMDNALPHFSSDEKLSEAAAQIRKKLSAGGIFVASIRDYDHVIKERPAVQGPGFFSDAGRRRVVFQVCDWMDERKYAFHLYITCETPESWQTHHGVAIYRAVLRNELTRILEGAGFARVRWMLPAESGFYQPLVVAVAG